MAYHMYVYIKKFHWAWLLFQISVSRSRQILNISFLFAMILNLFKNTFSFPCTSKRNCMMLHASIVKIAKAIHPQHPQKLYWYKSTVLYTLDAVRWIWSNIPSIADTEREVKKKYWNIFSFCVYKCLIGFRSCVVEIVVFCLRTFIMLICEIELLRKI